MGGVHSPARIIRAVGSAAERFVHTEEVTGSNPVPPMFFSRFTLISTAIVKAMRSLPSTERGEKCGTHLIVTPFPTSSY